MKKIMDMIARLDDEIESAENYAECSIEYKVKGNTGWQNRMHEASMDELKHAGWVHEEIVTTIDELSKVYVPPVEMQEIWDERHKNYVQKVAWIKQMLSM